MFKNNRKTKEGTRIKLYAAIDLHANSSVLVVLDEKDRIVLEGRQPHDLALILVQLAPHKKIEAIVVALPIDPPTPED